MRFNNQLTLLVCCSVVFFSCSRAIKPNTLTEDERKDGWVLLFDGQTTNGWHLFNKPGEPSAWFVSEGELKTEPNNTNGTHGDLLTDKTYENFDLTFEWKISKGGNSGVFINVKEDTSYRAAWATGPEYQLYDNFNAPENYLHGGLHSAGAIFGVSPVQNNAKPKPNGDWNQSRIIQKGGHISFWLNGVASAEEDIPSSHWRELVAGGGMKAYLDFGKAVSGHIGLQDWAKGVAFRSIKIRAR